MSGKYRQRDAYVAEHEKGIFLLAEKEDSGLFRGLK